jgi:hypothetical protein
MGNEGSRMNRGSSFRRRNSKSGQHYIAGKIIKNIQGLRNLCLC